MNIGKALIMWTANLPEIPEERRGSFALVPDTEFARAVATGARS